MSTSLGEKLPNVALFYQLNDCPKCGSKYCLSGIRTGPATLQYTSNYYRVVCLTCWHKSKAGKTELTAIKHWNMQAEPSRLLELRTHEGLTQEDLSHLSGVPQTVISAIERGKQNASDSAKQALADALNVNQDEI